MKAATSYWRFSISGGAVGAIVGLMIALVIVFASVPVIVPAIIICPFAVFFAALSKGGDTPVDMLLDASLVVIACNCLFYWALASLVWIGRRNDRLTWMAPVAYVSFYAFFLTGAVVYVFAFITRLFGDLVN